MMADGTLHDTDFVAWTEQQARLLRQAIAGRLDEPFDLENLAEEIESLGRSDLRAARSQIRRIIEHLLKLQFSPVEQPRDRWLGSISHARSDLDLVRKDSPSLRSKIDVGLSDDKAFATRVAIRSLRAHAQAAAAVDAKANGGAYTIEEILGDWFPKTEPLT